MRCATHPTIETELTCATCGTPICPDCLVQTPVGMKCQLHGLARPAPLPRRPFSRVALGLLAGFGISAAGSILVMRVPPNFLLDIILGIVLGGLGAQVIGNVSFSPRNRRLAVSGALAVLIGGTIGGPLVLSLAFTRTIKVIAFGVATLYSPWLLAFALPAAIVAYVRLR